MCVDPRVSEQGPWTSQQSTLKLSIKSIEALAKLLHHWWDPLNWGGVPERALWPPQGAPGESAQPGPGGTLSKIRGRTPKLFTIPGDPTPVPAPPLHHSSHPDEPPKKAILRRMPSKVTHPPSPKQPWTSRTRFHFLNSPLKEPSCPKAPRKNPSPTPPPCPHIWNYCLSPEKSHMFSLLSCASSSAHGLLFVLPLLTPKACSS